MTETKPRSGQQPIVTDSGIEIAPVYRAPAIPDLLLAATAELADLTVLAVDKDFDLIAEITGQPVERLQL